MYRVFYMNQFIKAFPYRDAAIDWVLDHANNHMRGIDDYEILDGSDMP
jgi:hypothetical protein